MRTWAAIVRYHLCAGSERLLRFQLPALVSGSHTRIRPYHAYSETGPGLRCHPDWHKALKAIRSEHLLESCQWVLKLVQPSRYLSVLTDHLRQERFIIQLTVESYSIHGTR